MGERYPERLVPLMLALSATTGLIDAVSVIGLGKVFTANMTGNIVFLGFGVAGATGFAMLPAFAALLAAVTANAFWLLPAGQERFMATNAFFEHLGLIGGFVLAAIVAELDARRA